MKRRRFWCALFLSLFLLFQINESRLTPIKIALSGPTPRLQPVKKDQFSEPPITFAESVIAGGVARLVAQLILHPLDSMRTRAQISASNMNSNIGKASFPLLRGIVPQIICSGPAGALQFSVLERCRSGLNTLGLSAIPSNIIASSLGALVATIIRIPQEEVKVACQSLIYHNAFQAFLSRYQLHGFSGFYRNAPVVILRDILWHSFSYTLFHAIKSYSLNKYGYHLSQNQEFLLGGFVGIFACVFTHPLDVIKTIKMTSSQDQSVLRIAQDLMFRSSTLTSGLLYRIAYLAPMSAITYAIYDLIVEFLSSRKI